MPQGAWQDITMDFVEGLPKSDGYNVILVVVDRYTKYAHFLPLKHPFTGLQVAKLFLNNVVKLHGISKSIVSDHDKVFTSSFLQELFKQCDTKLNLSTAYHPRSNGQSERVNQCLEMYLRCATVTSPTKWFSWLTLAEYWYNTCYHTTVGCTPFKALYGTDPHYSMVPTLSPSRFVEAYEVVQERRFFSNFL